MFAVTVTFTVKPGRMADFMPLMLVNAAASRDGEPDCLQFDVCTDPARSDQVFLYELYTDADAFDAHLQTPHFKTFAAQVEDMLAGRELSTFSKVVQ